MYAPNIKLLLVKTAQVAEGEKNLIHRHLEPLITELAHKYPRWEFHSEDLYHGNSTANRFIVFFKGEELGAVELSGYEGNYKYLLHCDRIRKEIERGYGKKTSDVGKAVKLVKKYFSPLSLEERLFKAQHRTMDALRTTMGKTSSAYRTLWSALESDLMDILVEEWDAVVQRLSASRVDSTAAKSFPEKYHAAKDMVAIDEAYKNGTAYVVMATDSNYAIRRRTGSEITIKSSEELPAYMRQALGMLKLMEANQFIANVGLRVDDTTFFVLEKEGGKIL